MLHDIGISVADRHRFGADPDPNFHVDANPDPADWHENDADPHADHIQSLHILENKKTFLLLAVLRTRIRRIRMFLGLLDPDPLVRCTDPDPSIIKLK